MSVTWTAEPCMCGDEGCPLCHPAQRHGRACPCSECRNMAADLAEERCEEMREEEAFGAR